MPCHAMCHAMPCPAINGHADTLDTLGAWPICSVRHFSDGDKTRRPSS